MIRIILFSAAFLGVSAALIIFQPGAMQIRDRLTAERDPSTVTRAVTVPDSLARTPAQPDRMPPPVANTDVANVLAALVREAQKQDAADPLAAKAPAAVRPGSADPAAALAAAVRASQGGGDADLARTTEAILKELGKAPAASGETDALMAMTQGVLANLNGGKPQKAAAKPGSLQTLVVQAFREGQSDAYLDALLNEARDTGQVVVPEALITSDNRVDTATLLATLFQRSVGAGAPVSADDPAGTRPRARPSGNSEIYTVQPGDSLAAISYRYYGDTMQYTVIFDANRDKITTPDKIRVGQKLTIPVL